ncbi:hypothetical protein UT300013_31840 [Paraclostridium sordellii]
MVQNLINFLNNLVSQGKTLLPYLAIGAVLVGAYLHTTGGREGLDKAKKWYIGAAVGLVIGLGANAIVELIQTNISF